jgi:hypothetical protein
MGVASRIVLGAVGLDLYDTSAKLSSDEFGSKECDGALQCA